MPIRAYPQDYLQTGENDFKSGIKLGAMLVLVGVVVGAAIVFIAIKGGK